MAPGADRHSRGIDIASAFYDRVLRLYPDRFYHANANDLTADFQDASHDSWNRDGVTGLLLAWLQVFKDLPVSLAREWLRTPWPVVLLCAGVVASVVVASVLRANPMLRAFRLRVAAATPAPSDSPQLLALLMMLLLVPAAGVLIAGGLALVKGRPRRCNRV